MAARTYAVTGVSGGIGAALARALRGAGHGVIGLDLRAPEDDPGSFVQVDLTDPASIRAAAASLGEPLDGLCNAAGLPPREGLEAAILAVNFTGTRALTEALLPRLREGGSIVNMASRAGHGWRDGAGQAMRLAALTDPGDLAGFVAEEGIDPSRAYALSKEAVILWTAAEAEPMAARGLRVNSISPGAVATGILDDFARAFGEGMARNVARAGRPGAPEEIAALAAFLLSPGAAWIKGADIAIDGGMGAFGLSDAMGLSAMRLPEAR